MAYRSRGLPSAGCNKCRSRKLRCDETKPICGRCTKIGFEECKYRDEFERTWRNQSYNPAEKSQEPATEESVEQTSKTDNGPHGRVSGQHASARDAPGRHVATLVLMPSGPGTQERGIIDRFFYDWVSMSNHGHGFDQSWMEFLPAMYRKSPPASVLVTSVNALAQASFGRRFGCAIAHGKAVDLCGKALHLLKDAIGASPDTPPTDDIMVSTFLLGMYETVMDHAVWLKGSWSAHMSGAIMLLSMRYLNPENSKIEPGIVAMVFGQMLHRSLLRGIRPALPLQVRELFCRSDLKHVYLESELVYQAAILCSEWRIAFENFNTSSSPDELCRIAGAAVKLDKSLEDWSRRAPSLCSYTVTQVSKESSPEWMWPLLEGKWVPQGSHAYPSHFTGTLWKFCWVARLILNHALLHTIECLQRAPLATVPPFISPKEVEFNFLSLIDRLCETCLAPLTGSPEDKSRPQTVEELRSYHGYALLQPLSALSHCLIQVTIEGIDLSGRQEWVRKMRKFLRKQMGFTKATADAQLQWIMKLPVQLWGLTGEAQQFM